MESKAIAIEWKKAKPMSYYNLIVIRYECISCQCRDDHVIWIKIHLLSDMLYSITMADQIPGGGLSTNEWKICFGHIGCPNHHLLKPSSSNLRCPSLINGVEDALSNKMPIHM